MRVFVTGGTGFIGGNVAAKLRERGDEVRALVRDPEKATGLRDLGCELVPGDLGDESGIRTALEGCDAAIHGAAIYKVGIRRRERKPMREANVLGTERVLRAALDAKTPRLVYISTVAAFGDTEGEVVDESHQHSGEYTSYYDETKHQAHQIARRLIDEEGLPGIIVQPGGVYGPNDHSELGNLIGQFVRGRMPMIPFPDLGLNLVHVEDVADGVLLALDKGKVGEQYVLGGELSTNRGLFEALAKVTDRKVPKRSLPTGLIRASAPFGPVVGPLLGFPPNLREVVTTSEATYWAKHDKAMRELGYSPRPLEQGLRDTLEAEGKLPDAAAA
jgi:nucleoside-diphosphate-sugar epimerase